MRITPTSMMSHELGHVISERCFHYKKLIEKHLTDKNKVQKSQPERWNLAHWISGYSSLSMMQGSFTYQSEFPV